jgi:hypothetical protein
VREFLRQDDVPHGRQVRDLGQRLTQLEGVEEQGGVGFAPGPADRPPLGPRSRSGSVGPLATSASAASTGQARTVSGPGAG